jgi:hypothetical protein
MMPGRWRSILIGMLLLASVAEFCVRGPLRLVRGMGWNDFLSPYIQAKAWVHGQDPYSPQSLIAFWPSDNQRPPWIATEAAKGTLEVWGVPTPYPLSSFVELSPFTALPWSLALWLWTSISIAAVVVASLALLSMCGCNWFDLRSQLFLTAVFALAPLHTGLATGNPAVLSVGLMIGSVWGMRTSREKLAGVLLAIAVCLKPTIAAGLLLYYLVRRQWKIAGIACAVAMIVGLAGIARLALAGVPWLPSYLENTRRIFAPGSLADFTQAGRVRFNLINAQVFFGGFFRSATVANFLSRFLATALLAYWIWLCYRRRGRSELLEISAVCVLSLIAVYHRFYDAALLIWPLAWSLLVVRRRSTAIVTLVAVAPFFVPGPVLLAGLADSGRISSSITNGWWWNTIVLSHESWDLMVLAFLLLYFMGREFRESSQSRESSQWHESAQLPSEVEESC